MKIKSFTYEDKSRHWRLDRVEFSDLTLLVGASGVGKTQILQAIYNMTQIALGASLNGVKWNIELEVDPHIHYIWSGEFENLGSEANNAIIDVLEEKQPRIIYESITHNNVDIIKRDETDIYFREIPTIRLDQNQSVLALIKDDPITLIERALKLITFNIHTYSIYRDSLYQRNSKVWLEIYPDLRSIRDSGETILRKLYLCSLVDYEVFNAIKQDFMDVFPFVEDIRFQQINRDHLEGMSYPPTELIQLQIKEKSINQWINEGYISSGMLRTLFQISELHLCPDGMVFLIDEFENSLGINCIDDLTSSIMTYERDLQFIITSHHPYIINNISYKNWKIVTRNGGVVVAKDATDYNLGKSKHQAFTQLINLDAYSEGVAE